MKCSFVGLAWLIASGGHPFGYLESGLYDDICDLSDIVWRWRGVLAKVTWSLASG